MQVVVVIEDDHLDVDMFDKFLDNRENIIFWDSRGMLKNVTVDDILQCGFSYIKGKLKSSVLSGNIFFLTNDIVVNDSLARRLKAVNECSDVTKYYDSWQPIFQEMFLSVGCVVPSNIDKSLAYLYKSQTVEMDMLDETCFGLSNNFVRTIEKDDFADFYEFREFIRQNSRNHVLLMDCYVRHRSIAAYNFELDDKLKIKLLLSVFSAVANNGRKNILYVIHADFHEMAENNVGGTQYHLKDLVMGVSTVYNVYVLARDRKGLRLTCYSGNTEQSSVFHVEGGYVGNLKYKNIYSVIYGFCLDLLKIDIVHVHHTINMTLGIFYEARNRNIPVVFTVHDYYTLCPAVKRECNLQPAKDRCNACLHKKGKINGEIDFWYRWWQDNMDVLGDCCRIVAPSHSAKEIFSQVFPISQEKLFVIEHGLPARKALIKNLSQDKFRVAFVGGLCPEKGSRLITDMINQGNNDIVWHLFGIISDDVLSSLKKPNLIQHGMYRRDEIIDLLTENKIDLVCILSFWEETYCYTLSEAVLAGIPVMATDLGAMGERVRAMRCGWLLSSNPTAEEALSKLDNIIKDKFEYEKVISDIQSIDFITVPDMNEQYLKMYYDVLRDSQSSSLHRPLELNDLIRFDFSAEKGEYCEQGLDELVRLNARLRKIYNSKFGRLAKEINHLRHRIMNF